MRSAVTEEQRECLSNSEVRCVCGGPLAVLAGDYVSWSHCLVCGETRLLAWVSCRPISLGRHTETPATDWPFAGRPW